MMFCQGCRLDTTVFYFFRLLRRSYCYTCFFKCEIFVKLSFRVLTFISRSIYQIKNLRFRNGIFRLFCRKKGKSALCTNSACIFMHIIVFFQPLFSKTDFVSDSVNADVMCFCQCCKCNSVSGKKIFRHKLIKIGMLYFKEL